MCDAKHELTKHCACAAKRGSQQLESKNERWCETSAMFNILTHVSHVTKGALRHTFRMTLDISSRHAKACHPFEIPRKVRRPPLTKHSLLLANSPVSIWQMHKQHCIAALKTTF